MVDYLALLEHSYNFGKEVNDCHPETRLAFVVEYLFDVTTYDEDLSAKMGVQILETMQAISTRTTFSYIKGPACYTSYIWVCNLPFIAKRIDWGGSIRGAWWSHDIRDLAFYPSGLYDKDNEPIDELKFSSGEDWQAFVNALLTFCAAEFAILKGRAYG